MIAREYIISVLKKYPVFGWRRLRKKWTPAKPIKRWWHLKEFSWDKYLRAKKRGRTVRAALWLRRHKYAKGQFYYYKDAATKKPQFNGHPDNVNNRVKEIIVAGNQHGLVVTSTTDGSSHTPTSHHYPQNNPDNLGGAVDMAGTREDMVDFQQYLVREKKSDIKELFGPDNGLCIKNGVQISIQEGTGLESGHDNHDHIAPY